MRLTDFKQQTLREATLLEYNRDVTVRNFEQKIIEKLGRMWSDFTSLYVIKYRKKEPLTAEQEQRINHAVMNIVKVAENGDPTPNKKFVPWLIRGWLAGGFGRIEDIESTGGEILEYYKDLAAKRQVPEEYKDLNSVFPKGIQAHDAKSAVAKLKAALEQAYDKMEKAGVTTADRGQAKEYYTGQHVRIIELEDEKAACYYGRGTTWCTAATRSQNMFNHYKNTGSLYVFIPTSAAFEGEKYQLWISDGGHGYQFMDEEDTPANLWEKLTQRFGFSPEFIVKLFPGLAAVLPQLDAKGVQAFHESLKAAVSEWYNETVSNLENDNWGHYVDFLDREGYTPNEDGEYPDDTPSYLEYDEDARDALTDVWDDVHDNFNINDIVEAYEDDETGESAAWDKMDTAAALWIESQGSALSDNYSWAYDSFAEELAQNWALNQETKKLYNVKEERLRRQREQMDRFRDAPTVNL